MAAMTDDHELEPLITSIGGMKEEQTACWKGSTLSIEEVKS